MNKEAASPQFVTSWWEINHRQALASSVSPISDWVGEGVFLRTDDREQEGPYAQKTRWCYTTFNTHIFFFLNITWHLYTHSQHNNNYFNVKECKRLKKPGIGCLVSQSWSGWKCSAAYARACAILARLQTKKNRNRLSLNHTVWSQHCYLMCNALWSIIVIAFASYIRYTVLSL